MSKLKPCPFCGGEAEVEQIPSSTWDKFAPHCKSRKCVAFYIGYCDEGIYDTKTKAIEAWNTRANGWIPVSDPPKDGTQVLVTLAYTYVSEIAGYGIARYIDFGNGERHWAENHYGYLEWDKYSDGRGGCSLYKVIAWQPLPAPYKGV